MPDETQNLKITVKINAETKQLEVISTQIDKLGTNVDTATKKTGLFNATHGKSEGGLRRLGNALGIDLTAFAGTTGAAIAFAKVLKDSVDNEEKEIQRQRTLKITLDAMKIGYDKNKDAIDKNLKSLTNHTKFMREEAYDVYNKAVLSQGSLAGGYKLVKIAMDEASRTGKPLNEVLETLTTALAGGARGTKVLKEEFGVLVGNGKNAAEMIENAGKAIDGTAKKETDLATETKGLKQEYTDITTIIGKGLMPVIMGLTTIIKVVLVPVIAILSYAVAGCKTVFDSLTGAITIFIAFMTSGWRGAAAAAKDVAKEMSKDLGDSTKFLGDSFNTLFGTMKTGSADAGNAVLKNVQPPLEKVAKTAKITKDDMEKSFDEVAKSVQNTLGNELDKVFKKIATEGGSTKEILDEAFTGIYQSFRDMLIKMVAELVAREAIIGLLTLLSGGGVGIATTLLKTMTATPATGAVGAMDTGSASVPRTGNYYLKKGEKVSTGDSGGNGGNTTVINVGVQAFDTRMVSRVNMDKLANQLEPYITRNQQKKGKI